MNKASSRWTLLVLAVLTTGCLYLISQLKVNYDFEAYFPQDSSETDFFVNYREVFETDNDFFFVALENEKGIFDPVFLQHADSLANLLKTVPYMVEVQVITQLQEYSRDPFMGTVFRSPVLSINDSLSYPADSTRIYSQPQWVGVFVSEDARSLAINMKHIQHLSKAKSDELALRVQELVGQFEFDKVHVIGRALGQKMYVETMISELLLFISISLGLTVVFLFIAFRSGWGVVIPTLVVLMAIIWTLGFVKLIGKDIDLMMTILPTIIFVVGMSDSVHVLTKYMQELRNGREKMDAIRYAFKSIRLATFLTALTTSIGFMTLVFSNIKPISDFGIYTSVGVMLAYGLTYTMLPAILILGKPKRMVAFALSDDFWTRRLERFFLFVIQKRKWILWGGVAILGISFWGISLLTVDNKMLEDLRDDHILKQEFSFMENHFSGCRPFEMALKLKPGFEMYDQQVLAEAEELQDYLQEEYKVGNVFSLVNLIKEANKTWHGGQDTYFQIPADSAMVEIRSVLQRKRTQAYVALAANDSVGWLRIAGKVPDAGRQHYDSLNTKVERFIQQKGFTSFDVQITGTAHLIDLNNELLVDNLVLDLLLSVLCIGLVMGIVYKSFKMIFLTIIPNLIPLLIVAGIMGFTGIPIKVSTSIIFNIAFGIAVDDTVHFLARVRTLLGDGLSVNYAVKRTFLTTGKAMIVTTLILSGGFLTLMFSDFLGTFYIGLLISLTLFIAIAAELLFSPLIVMYFYKKVPASFIQKTRGIKEIGN